jgi:Arc/MetJ family transcription regulator
MRLFMPQCIKIDDAQESMRTTVTIDDELYQRALEVADPGTEKSDLFREAMKVFVRVQAGKRLAALGGTAPDMKDIPRRRPETEPRQ